MRRVVVLRSRLHGVGMFLACLQVFCVSYRNFVLGIRCLLFVCGFVGAW